jgi:squalene synthase HpnC
VFVEGSVSVDGGQWDFEDCHHSLSAQATAVALLPRDFVSSVDARNRVWTIGEAEQYTRWLATHHYENFHVVSFLLPRELHQDFYNVYSYCRWADDLADEIGDLDESLRLLDWWSAELERMYAGEAQHPVFVALRGTAKKYGIPKQPFADLIRAFIQDQKVTRYQTWEGVLDYCVYSANPVGRLVLYLCGYSDAERHGLSDATCTALQLANFWQDITVDQLKDRVYLPLDLLAKHRYTVADLFAHRYDERFREVMREAVDRARELFLAGLPLNRMVNRRLAVDLELFSRGGMRILDKIERQDYDVLSRRPRISKIERVSLLIGTLARVAFARAA